VLYNRFSTLLIAEVSRVRRSVNRDSERIGLYGCVARSAIVAK